MGWQKTREAISVFSIYDLHYIINLQTMYLLDPFDFWLWHLKSFSIPVSHPGYEEEGEGGTEGQDGAKFTLFFQSFLDSCFGFYLINFISTQRNIKKPALSI